MRTDDQVRIRHMLDAGHAAQRFIQGRDRNALDCDQMLLFALVRAIEVLGEAAAKVSDETRALAPDLPWAAIVAMRNRLIHGYFDVDADLVWLTVTRELPSLLHSLEELLRTG